MLRCTLENRNVQTKQLQAAVSNVEKHFGELCQFFAACVQKTARPRDEYAATETPHLKLGLMNFADEFVERLEAKVATFTARNREAKQLTQVEGTGQRNPPERHVITQNYKELKGMLPEQVEETIDNFERQKIKARKTIFSKFFTIEMLFHSKTLEAYTAAYQNIQKIDEDEDLDLESLYAPDYSSHLDMVRANSKSPHQTSLSAKCASGTVQVSDQPAEDDEDEELDVTEEENFLK
uniref:Family with sequence similarity 92 member A n=1 Tax=Rhinopithecus roxellana TaxID=61622 RepID=A0A2K6P1L7_RHIRO